MYDSKLKTCFIKIAKYHYTDAPLNLIYNLADLVNKIAFCLSIWHAAKAETKDKLRALA